MKMLETKSMTAFRTGAVALVLALGLLTASPVAAQDDAILRAPAAAQVDDDSAEDDVAADGGFDDWGLLGLLGLLGLAGLLKRPDGDVRTVERPVVEPPVGPRR
ncbi:MAG TPA: WGxxGxxG family protein [Thermomicrobiales bacterium]|nr:WGxxGxxG family protein [Thermomicrobiales bacterium]